MTDLLPCWKCGSPAHMLPTIDARVMIACPESGLGAEHGAWVIEDTEEEAIAAWNTRAERTCRITYREDYAPEQSDCQIIECSNGCFFYWPTYTPLFYCPKCGARVTSENKPVEVWQQASADDVTCYEVEE